MGKSKKELVSLKKKVTPCSLIQIKEGELLTDIDTNKWRIGKPVGAGGFGEIYLVSDEISKSVPQDTIYVAKIELHKSGPLFVERNFYIRVAKKESIEEWKKHKGLKHLGMPYYITFGSHIYQNEKYRFLILQRFGQDLSKVFVKCKKFHIKTVLTLGIQILDILEYIHSHGYIHADIKDSNLLLSNAKGDENIYLLDYGLACKYIDKLGLHKEYNPDQRKAHDGTLQYTSRDAHVGAHSRRSDLEVLAYNMVHWLSGSLPWKNELTDPEKVAQEKKNCMNNIPAFLKKCFGDNPPVVLTHFLKYIVSLNFETEPDYEYCKTLLRQGIHQAGYADDGKLNFNSAPAKLRNKKRLRNSDIENCKKLKPIKVSRNSSRQPCVPVQANFNRMTRQQTAASTLALRSSKTFDWVKVLQSNPEKILKVQGTPNDQINKKKIQNKFKEKLKLVKICIKKEKEDPLKNPTPAILEVLKCRSSSTNHNLGKRTRSESLCCSPVFYDNMTLTPAMEEVIRRREIRKKIENDNSNFYSTASSSSVTASTRLTRLKSKSKIHFLEESECFEIKKGTRKSNSDSNTLGTRVTRKKNEKFSLEEHKLRTTPSSNTSNKKKIQSTVSKRKKAIKKYSKSFPALSKSSSKVLSISKQKKLRRREVSPSETDFVPRLRSKVGDSQHLFNKTLCYNFKSKQKIRNYAANSSSLPEKRKHHGMNCNGLSSSLKDSSIIL